jgi:ApbE superfamily uncharacterized protein (UPF0280 family)
MKNNLYTYRFYRKTSKPKDLYCYEVKEKESDLLVSSGKNLKATTLKILKNYRKQIEEYIEKDPHFASALTPYKLLKDAPLIARKMQAAGKACGVGPMAAVAGAISQFLGKDLLKLTDEVIIENGGDIFIKTKKTRRVAIFSGDTAWKDKLILIIKPEQTPLGICTSSGKIGHSLSFGKADAVAIISDCAILADAVATAIGNMIQSPHDIPKAIRYCKKIKNIKGVVIVKDSDLGIWGDIELEEIAKNK